MEVIEGVEGVGEAVLEEAIVLGLVGVLPEDEAALPEIEAVEVTRIEVALVGDLGAIEAVEVEAEALLPENKEGKRLVSNGCAMRNGPLTAYLPAAYLPRAGLLSLTLV
jgi:hypothetical protein